jgi:hypothetical protein
MIIVKPFYISAHQKVIIICKNCNTEFLQEPNNHLCFHGCPKCSLINSQIDKSIRFKKFIQKAKIVHGDKYDYSNIKYENSGIKVHILCNHCKTIFTQAPANHLSGNGCNKCGIILRGNKLRKTTEDFINRSNKVHSNLYDYSKTEYVKSDIKVVIICKFHGEFTQTPSNHLSNHGCPKCIKTHSDISISWLDYMQVSNPYKIQHAENGGEYSIPGQRFRVDGFCKETNTIYEFYGDFWHGHPKYNPNDINQKCNKSFGQLLEFTKNRKSILIDLGYNVIEMWENDWSKAIKLIRKYQKRRQSPP